MDHKIITEIIYLILALISFNYWKQTKERGWLWFIWVLVIGIFASILNFIIVNVLQTSIEVKLFSTKFFGVVDLLLIISMIVVLFKGFTKKSKNNV